MNRSYLKLNIIYRYENNGGNQNRCRVKEKVFCMLSQEMDENLLLELRLTYYMYKVYIGERIIYVEKRMSKNICVEVIRLVADWTFSI